MFYKYGFCLTLLMSLYLGFTIVPRVWACSGGGTDNIQDLLARTGTIVKADVIAVDDVRQNGILSVESVLYGISPEYLLFLQNDPVVVTRMTEGDPYGACDFFESDLHTGLTAYFFLERRADGVYISTSYWTDPDFYSFSDDSTLVTFYSQGDEGYVEHQLDESEFVEFITTYGSSEVVDPQAAPFPRLAPLKITTVDGTAYMLPIDTTVPVEVTPEFYEQMTIATLFYDSTDWNERYFRESVCPGASCIQVSPNGIQRGLQNGERVEWFGGSAVGQAFLFASTGDAIAIWSEDNLEFYTLGWQKHDQPFSEVTLLNAVALSGGDASLMGQGAWTPDGRQFAYSDSQGLWLLDVYGAADPVLLLPESVPLALRFSPLGRYLQVDEGYQRFHLDIVSGEKFPDGLLSPDDRLLLTFNTRAAVFALQLCPLAPARDCQPGRTVELRTGVDTYEYYDRFRQVEWDSPYSFLATVCERSDDERCIVVRYLSTGYGGYWYNSQDWIRGDRFAYFPNGDTLAIVQDDFTLAIDGHAYDLSAFLESPITAVGWLPSLFYSASSP